MAKHGNAFKAAREAVGLTQVEAARRSGVAQSIISDLETGKNTNPSWDVISRLSQIYGVPPDQLLPPAKLPRRKFTTVKSIAQPLSSSQAAV